MSRRIAGQGVFPLVSACFRVLGLYPRIPWNPRLSGSHPDLTLT